MLLWCGHDGPRDPGVAPRATTHTEVRDSLYRVTVNTRQHCTDNAEGARPSNTSIRATLRRCTVGKLSAHY